MKRALLLLALASCAHAPERMSFDEAEQEQFPPQYRRAALEPQLALYRPEHFLPPLALTAWPGSTGLAGNANCSNPSAACSSASFTSTAPSTGDAYVMAGGAKFELNGAGGGIILDYNSAVFPGDVAIRNTSGSVALRLSGSGGVTSSHTVTAPNFAVTSTTAPTNGLYITGTNEVGLQAVSAKVLACNGSSGACSASSGQFVSKAGGAGLVSIGSTLIGQFTIDATVHNSGADTTEDTLWTYSLPGAALDATGRSLRITAWGDGVSTADVTTVRCYFGATVVLSKVLTASQANTWRVVYEVTRTGATTQNASGTLWNGGTATSFVQSNTTPAETLSGAVTIKCTGQRATSSVASSVRQLYALGEFIN